VREKEGVGGLMLWPDEGGYGVRTTSVLMLVWRRFKKGNHMRRKGSDFEVSWHEIAVVDVHFPELVNKFRDFVCLVMRKVDVFLG